MNSNNVNKPESSPTGNLTEEECIERTLKGDMAAFEVLYRMHVDRVYAICLRLTGSRELADRLTQDVFVQTWEKLSTFRGESAFTTWLHRLAVNTVLQDRRKEKRLQDRFLPTGDEAVASTPFTTPAVGMRIDLERAIAQLPDRARTVFVLHDVEGYRHEEIARMMNTSIGTSKAQLHRARNLLRKALEK
jgi:RNA polymerase sigma-70 factor (ECF subfamily)